MKRKNQQVNKGLQSPLCGRKVFFNEGRKLATRKTKRLKHDAFPSVFYFSAYTSRMTDCPTQQANSDLAVRCKERAQQRISLKEQR